MPKKKAKKKNGDKGGETAEVKEKGPFIMPTPSSKESSLRQELHSLDEELDTLKKQVEELRTENEWLHNEAEKTRQENEEYQAYMSKKSQKRQSLIVSLSDKNLDDLQKLEKEKDGLMKDFEDRKSYLRTMILEKETELAKINKELKDLEHYKALQHEQESEIAKLERKLEDMRFKHEDKLRALKTQFLKEKRAFEESSSSKVQSMASDASREAVSSLERCTRRVQSENQALRLELQQLIQMTQDLQRQKKQLEKQYTQLQREHQFTQDLRKLRAARMGIRSVASEDFILEFNTPDEYADQSLPEISPSYSSTSKLRH